MASDGLETPPSPAPTDDVDGESNSRQMRILPEILSPTYVKRKRVVVCFVAKVHLARIVPPRAVSILHIRKDTHATWCTVE